MPIDKPRVCRVLVVEDEFLIALETVRELELCGVEVVGPLSHLTDALNAAEREAIDGAVLDVNLRGQLVFPVAAALARRGIPFIFATSYDAGMIPPEFAGAPRFAKPVDPSSLVKGVTRLSEQTARARACACDPA